MFYAHKSENGPDGPSALVPRLKSRVCGRELSITIDQALLAQAGMFPYEKVLVVDIENGARFETYVITGPAGSGAIELNGAAARLVTTGDRLIIMTFSHVDFPPPQDWAPIVLVLDEYNAIRSIEREEVCDAPGH